MVAALGLPPDPDAGTLRAALDGAGLPGAPLELHLVGGGTLHCPAGGTTCVATRSRRS
ncbi:MULTISPECIES: hypothetical protein [unclassified Kitasatospora]|uniref:hypothetical protein n=1 Tax=unclassified Kitasatospora TaxID=2633591 RepID=UPI0012FA626A|nr:MULTISPECIES: hypothetical protein [unclassified Kitasatospora]